MIINPWKNRKLQERFHPKNFFNPGCNCCGSTSPPYYAGSSYNPRRMITTTTGCQSCGSLTLPDTLTLTVVKLDATCPCMDAGTFSMVYADSFTHPDSASPPAGIPCTILTSYHVADPLQDCNLVVGPFNRPAFEYLYFDTVDTGGGACRLRMALVGSSTCGVGFYFPPTATRIVSCSPINFEFDFNLGGRFLFPGGAGCTNPTHTMILTQ